MCASDITARALQGPMTGTLGGQVIVENLGGANGDENVLWRLVGLYGDGATQIKHTDHEQWFIAPSATMYFNDHATRLTLHGLYQNRRS
ncbi:hypothetical protein [Lactiplantibacillus plantarum]|uniref:hypothetical protein n=1 Tax=Lactiplantibacillus plantarum TaxID=1590 RepID=UPI0040454E4D